LIVFMARPNDQLALQLFAMNWLWLIVAGILVSVIPFGLWFRLIRARSRRRQMLRSEWEL
jgi:hypothetical protein